MTNKTNLARALFALVAAIAVTLVVASPASASKLGSSTLKPNHGTFEGFADIGIGVETTGKAKGTDKGLHFPITRGSVDPETGKAKFWHTGGLKFSYNGMSVEFSDFIVKVAGKKNLIKGDIGSGKTRFADLNAKKIDIQEKKDGKLLYSNIKVFLAKKGAKLIEKELGLGSDYDLAGIKLGKLTTKFKSGGAGL